jgi:PAS domain-containing protein
MVTTLIEEKRIISEQPDQIGFLHAYSERIMNNIKAAIVVTDTSGAIEFSNTYFLELTGTDFTSLIGEKLSRVVGRFFSLRSGEGTPEDIPLDSDAVIEGLRLQKAENTAMFFTAKIRPIMLSGNRRGSLVVLPSLILILVFVYGFIAWSLRVSISRWDGVLPDFTFVGLRNYASIFTNARFQIDLWNTVFFTVLFLAVTIAAGPSSPW